jgi:hypothetical protein
VGGKIAFLGIPKKGEQKQKWSPTKVDKIRIGNLTPAFSGAQKRVEMLLTHSTHNFSRRRRRGDATRRPHKQPHIANTAHPSWTPSRSWRCGTVGPSGPTLASALFSTLPHTPLGPSVRAPPPPRGPVARGESVLRLRTGSLHTPWGDVDKFVAFR